ncbi:MAG: hypothetical protein M1834_004212 [Cirrosporium novae-zelandiae]|nr:MAG: hypothetical protein M1834_004212 [Cirrosporium novae-zelandiae]
MLLSIVFTGILCSSLTQASLSTVTWETAPLNSSSYITKTTSFPQTFVPYNFTPTPTVSSNLSTFAYPGPCVISCDAEYPHVGGIGWTNPPYSITVTAATVLYYVNNATNSTRTVTEYASLPSGYSFIQTNSDGTQTTRVTALGTNGINFTTDITYPSRYMTYASEYSWWGQLSTTVNGSQSVCVTAVPGPLTETLKSHPAYPQETKFPTDSADPKGLRYRPFWFAPADMETTPLYSFFRTAFADEAAFQTCALISQGAYINVMGVTFLTKTTTVADTNIKKQQPTPASTYAKITTDAKETHPLSSIKTPVEISEPTHTTEVKETQSPQQTAVQNTETPDAPATEQQITASYVTVVNNSPSNEATTSPNQPQSIVVGSQTIPYSTVFVPTVISGQTTSTPVMVIGSQPVEIGKTITVSNVPIAITTFAGQTHAIVGGSSTIVFSAVSYALYVEKPTVSPAAIIIGSQTYNQNSASEYIISGQTLATNNPVTLGSGSSTTIIALTTDNSGSTAIVIGGSTSPLPAVTSLAVVIGGQTLHAGQTITIGTGISATVYALATNAAGSIVVPVDAIKIQVLPTSSEKEVVTSIGLGAYIISGLGGGSETASAESNGDLVIDSQTLSQGGSITIGDENDGGSPTTVLALTTNTAGEIVVVVGGTITVPLESLTNTNSPLVIIPAKTQTLSPGESTILTTNSAGQTIETVISIKSTETSAAEKNTKSKTSTSKITTTTTIEKKKTSSITSEVSEASTAATTKTTTTSKAEAGELARAELGMIVVALLGVLVL